MKSPFALPAFAATLAVLLSACGQTGPLYMPRPPAGILAGAPATTAPSNQATPANTISPPAPAAGVSTPAAGSNANNTQGPQTQAPQSSPATQR